MQNNKTENDFVEFNKRYEEQKHQFINAFWSFNRENFISTWELIFKERLYNNDMEKDHDNFSKNFILYFVESLQTQNTSQLISSNLDDIVKTWTLKLDFDMLIMVLWQTDFKNASLELLENHNCYFTSEKYDNIYKELIIDIREHNPKNYNLPLNVEEKNRVLLEEKNTFLHIQNKYSTYQKIHEKLLEKNIKTNHKKI